MSRPAPEELSAWLAGRLPPDRAAAVDAWIAAIPEAEAAAVLASFPASELHLDLAAPALEIGFATERAAGRVRAEARLGEGGMAEVLEARDTALDRVVAVKVLKPRRNDESLDTWLLRQAAFRREAAITARLSHPGIVPVYDIGRWDGRPAFTMQRLTGRTLAAAVAERRPVAELVQALIRAAEAVASAHSQGIVHRDLTPEHILLGPFGEVLVLDWGVAERVGAGAGVRAGSPGWMAPEQAAGAAADPRMDVWSLGRLLALVLGGAGPRGLAAVATRATDADPAQRYPDAAAVAAELSRWLTDGVTAAEAAHPLELAWLRLRRSPRLRSAAVALALAVVGLVATWWWLDAADRAEALARVTALEASVPLDRIEALEVAVEELAALRRRQPRLTEAAALEARLLAARDLARRQAEAEALRERLAAHLTLIRRAGPWVDQSVAMRATLRQAGLGLRPETADADADLLGAAPQAHDLARALAFLWRSERERGADHHAALTAGVLARGGPTSGWQALGRLLGRTEFLAHDPVFCVCEDSNAVMADPPPATTALALFPPDERLADHASQLLAAHPGDFWALHALARHALANRRLDEAERLALIASGAEPGSLLPGLILTYAAVLQQDWPVALIHAERAQAIDPGNHEVAVLRTAALARLGRRAEAEHTLARLPAAHLAWHRNHRVGHLMEVAVDAVVDAGLRLTDTDASLGPLSEPAP